MAENSKKHRRKLAVMVVASMDMQTLIDYAEASLEVDYEESNELFECDAKTFNLEEEASK